MRRVTPNDCQYKHPGPNCKKNKTFRFYSSEPSDELDISYSIFIHPVSTDDGHVTPGYCYYVIVFQYWILDRSRHRVWDGLTSLIRRRQERWHHMIVNPKTPDPKCKKNKTFRLYSSEPRDELGVSHWVFRPTRHVTHQRLSWRNMLLLLVDGPVCSVCCLVMLLSLFVCYRIRYTGFVLVLYCFILVNQRAPFAVGCIVWSGQHAVWHEYIMCDHVYGNENNMARILWQSGRTKWFVPRGVRKWPCARQIHSDFLVCRRFQSADWTFPDTSHYFRFSCCVLCSLLRRPSYFIMDQTEETNATIPDYPLRETVKHISSTNDTAREKLQSMTMTTTEIRENAKGQYTMCRVISGYGNPVHSLLSISSHL